MKSLRTEALMPRSWFSPGGASPVWALLFAGALLINGCKETAEAPKDKAATNSQDNATTLVVNDFADNVVIPTYEQLVARSTELSEAVDTFVAEPTDAKLEAAQAAWKAARTPWEQSEAFAFGPAESLGYDGDLDDWPVNETDVQAILSSSDELTSDYIEELQTTEKGFHTIELLLFGLDNDKQAGDFTGRELELLKLLADAFDNTANELLKSWIDGVEGNPPYRQVFITAGDEDNSAYPTVAAAVEEIVQGTIGCLDEVGNEKIGVPLEEKTTDDLESRFSHTSLDDFKNNLLSVQNAYLGKVPEAGTDGKSVSDLVAEADADLDKQVQQELQAAIEALNAVPDPLEPQIADDAAIAKLETAKQAVLTVFETVEAKVLPLVQG